MRSFLLMIAALGLAAATTDLEHDRLERRINNGLGKTPALGWNSWVSYLI
jgi:alpha-galactosidase